MTVSELIAELQKYPGKAPVMIRLVDYDENHHRPVEVVGLCSPLAGGMGRELAALVLSPR